MTRTPLNLSRHNNSFLICTGDRWWKLYEVRYICCREMLTIYISLFQNRYELNQLHLLPSLYQIFLHCVKCLSKICIRKILWNTKFTQRFSMEPGRYWSESWKGVFTYLHSYFWCNFVYSQHPKFSNKYKWRKHCCGVFTIISCKRNNGTSPSLSSVTVLCFRKETRRPRCWVLGGIQIDFSLTRFHSCCHMLVTVQRFGLVIGFIKQFQFVTTSNSNSLTNLHNLQITTAHINSSVFITCCLVTASSNGDCSASVLTFLLDGHWLTTHAQPQLMAS
jgi:hypothetical protein